MHLYRVAACSSAVPQLPPPALVPLSRRNTLLRARLLRKLLFVLPHPMRKHCFGKAQALRITPLNINWTPSRIDQFIP